MFQVVKRDGELDEFKMGKITAAIDKAFDAKGKNYSSDMIDLLGLRVTADFQNKIENNRISVEDIQDSVENVLIQAGYSDVAKAYILYRKQREKIRNMKSTILDYKEIVNSYVKVEDWRVKENSTVTYSVGGLILSNSGAVTANYWLSEIYDNEIAEAHRNADIHIHDLSMLTGYCAGWSLKQLIREGLGGIEGKITSAPAKHLSVLCNQMVNFLGIMQNEWAGAQAFSSFDTYLAPFVKVDNLSYPEVKKCIESFLSVFANLFNENDREFCIRKFIPYLHLFDDKSIETLFNIKFSLNKTIRDSYTIKELIHIGIQKEKCREYIIKLIK